MSETETELAAAAGEVADDSPPAPDDVAPDDAAPDDPAATDDLLAQFDAVTAERDDYLHQLQRQQAEFANYRRRMATERRQQVAAGVGKLVESLLPVLDGCDAAAAQGHTEVDAVGQSLMVALGKAGLERIDAVGEDFDPTQHEAVIVEQAADAETSEQDAVDADEADDTEEDAQGGQPADRQFVVEELRSGYRFEGRVLRAAMVKVRTG